MVNKIKIDQKWAEYIAKKASTAGIGFIPRNAKNLTVTDLVKLGGGIHNFVYFSTISFLTDNKLNELPVVLKMYSEEPKVVCKRESEVISGLERFNFPVPHLLLQETDESILGYPFIVMERISGRQVGDYLNDLSEEKRFCLIRDLANTLVELHSINSKDFSTKAIKISEDGLFYIKDQVKILRDLKSEWGVDSSFDFAIDWLECNTAFYPCQDFSLLHGDMNLNNFVVTQEGKLVIIDWEYPEIGDSLRDVGLTYHNLRFLFGIRGTPMGEKYAEYFAKVYIEQSKLKISDSALTYYLILTAVLEALSYRHNYKRALNPTNVREIFGMKYVPISPLISLRFKLKADNLKAFITKKIDDSKKIDKK